MDKIIEKLNLNTPQGMKNLFIFLLVLVIVMVLINGNSSKDKIVDNTVETVKVAEEETFEKRLEKILQSMNGVSHVNVMIAYENTIEKVPLYDTKEVTTLTEEFDQNGGERKTRETNNEYKIAYEETGSTKTALVKQNIMPKMIGVIVTYEGESNSVTKENILNAVMAVTGLGSNKIQVISK